MQVAELRRPRELVERIALAGQCHRISIGTWIRSPSGEWIRRESTSRFVLLDATSTVGEPCPYLTRQWTTTRRAVLRLIDQGRIEADA